MDFAVPADHKIKVKESEKKDKYPRPCKGIENTMEHEGDNSTYRDWCFWYNHRRIIKGTGGIGGWRTRGGHLKNNIIENGQNTEKSPGDLRRLVVSPTPVRDHQLKLMRKTLIE